MFRGGHQVSGEASAGLQVLSNSSNTHAVAWTDDQTAILVPSFSDRIAYTAETLGLSATCQSITSECLCTTSAGLGGCAGTSEAILGLNCTGEHSYNTVNPGNAGYATGLLLPSGISTDFLGVTSNPFYYGDVVSSETYVTDGFGVLSNTTGFYAWGNLGGVNVLYCQVTALNVEYTYSPEQKYQVLSSTPSDLNTTRLLAQGM